MLLVNDVILREPLWHLPQFVACVGPVLASAASAAIRLAATRSIEPEELLEQPTVRLDVEACAGPRGQARAHHRRRGIDWRERAPGPRREPG